MPGSCPGADSFLIAGGRGAAAEDQIRDDAGTPGPAAGAESGAVVSVEKLDGHDVVALLAISVGKLILSGRSFTLRYSTSRRVEDGRVMCYEKLAISAGRVTCDVKRQAQRRSCS